MSTNISSKKHLQNMAEKLCRCTHCKDILTVLDSLDHLDLEI